MPEVAHVGDVLQGRYAIERELGRGGMATVYLARDEKLHRPVALKILHPEFGATLGPERFLREIELSARLSHPSVLALYDSGEADGRLFYAMPYVAGESLRQRLEREGQLSVEETVRIVRAVAGALDYAHAAGVVHRDIKPENVLLATDPAGGPPTPLVADFGIARALDVAGGERLTETGLALGTPAYMSPEQASPGGRIDGRGDIYSLGCVAYEMLAGTPPFTGPTAQAVMARHAVDPVPPLRTVRSTVPREVAAAIERALAKVPADRFASADEFAQALAGTGKPARRRFTSNRRRFAVLVVGAGVMGVSALFLRGSVSPDVLPSASKIAVLPLLSLGRDTALTRLGKDLATTISATLEGVGGIETADRLSVAASTAGEEAFSPADGASLARRLGATSVVYGTLVGAGEQVRLDLGLYSTEGLAPLARGITVTTHRDSIGPLTDSAAIGLLRQVWQRGEPPSPSITAVTTRSIPALRAFLQGEQAIVDSRWTDAELAFTAAIQADSAFTLAYWRHTFARWWSGQGLDDANLSTALARTSELPERDRMLAAVWRQKHSEVATQGLLTRARAVTERFPDYWPGWLEYGDGMFHFGPGFGHDLRQARHALQRAVELNPRLSPAWGHLLHTLVLLEDTAQFARSLAQLDTLDLPGMAVINREQFLHFPPAMMLHLMRGGLFEGPLADTVVNRTPTLEGAYTQAWSAFWFSSIGRPDVQIKMSRRVLAGRPARTMTGFHRKGIAVAWAARGSWDSALAAMDGFAERGWELAGLTSEEIGTIQESPELAQLDPYRLAAIGAWLGALDPRLAAARREAAARTVTPMASRRPEIELLWLDGLVAASERSLGGVREAQNRIRAVRRRLTETDTMQYRTALRSLSAFESELLGQRRQAADAMAALAWEGAIRWHGGTYSYGLCRLAAARWLMEAGDLDQAARLLLWHQGVSTVVPPNSAHEVAVLAGLSYLEIARAEAARGDRELAREYYGQFLRRYDSPSPRMRHLVEEASAAVRRLE